MKTSFRLTALAVCCLTATGAAQAPAAPVSDALRSIEQPQVSQSPVHTPVKAWANVFEFIPSDVSGLNDIIT